MDHNISEHAIFLWLVILGPLVDLPLLALLKRSKNANRRIYAYGITIATSIILTAILWPGRGMSLFQSPFGPPSVGLQAIAWILIGLMALNTLQTWIHVRKSAENRLSVSKVFAVLDFVLPTNRSERLWFVPLAASAGIFEEILYRSFLIRYLEFLPLWLAALASATVFGIAHFYQGLSGVIGTFIAALIFTIIVAGTGTLWIAMLVHALWDLRVLMFMLPADHPPKT